MTSPPRGFSILITSAPMSASRWVANGPAAACSKARILMPVSADSAIFRLGEGVVVRRECLLPHHHAAAVVDHYGAILLDATGADLDDAPPRARFRLSRLQ